MSSIGRTYSTAGWLHLSKLSPGIKAALVVTITGAVCLALSPYFPSLTTWPAQWTLPMTEWIGSGLTLFLEAIKPAMRFVSGLLAYPMDWANSLLNYTPWPIVIAVVTATGWYLGGVWMAALGFFGLTFVLASGYWVQSMNTLGLVAISVPLALIAGGIIGIFANEFPKLKSTVQVVLDVMQTVPTFAYLTPLLLFFGFGPVVGLIASAIYAAPPIARNVILGLERVEQEIKEAAIMSGANRFQQLFLVEIPAASTQIMVGVNQCLMAALSMVIIAAVIGGFNDIGWEVLLTMRKAQFGQSLLAGLVIVVFAIVIDRMSGALATERKRYDLKVGLAILAAGIILTILFWSLLPKPGDLTLLHPAADYVDETLGSFTANYGATLDSFKNGALFFVLLPFKIGLDDAVLPFTWGFQWTATNSLLLFSTAIILALYIWYRGHLLTGLFLLIAVGIMETGIANLPWPFVLIAIGALGWVAGGRKLSFFCVSMLVLILLSGLWERALLSLYLCSAAVMACVVLGGSVGLLCAVSNTAWKIIRPICDMLQTIPLFVFLIPVLMFFQIGEFSAFLAIVAYAVVPMIRYTQHGLVNTPDELMEAAISTGATTWQILRDVKAPYSAPTILLGLNQSILYAFAMLVIAALIGTTGLGQSIYLALGKADIGLGIASGAAMAMLALIADRLVQGFAKERREALGL